ncbi:hypothetical protein GCK72_021874 [Caenorhabditis remanei]|uniref:Glycosyltransferase family 92 protein n=1 Tax=Caenorhabditis remanei TaxID=31234 RepID=A0A6A5GL90_CAERE|nr:hypothetical protein GCK72_021874 [Caenorhabditis remanei]KAF1755305.1 hypothetical protein GCK72_021874 [Caenorhabditis remanei]
MMVPPMGGSLVQDYATVTSSVAPFHCPVESWNQVHLDTIPLQDLHLEYVRNNISRRDNILGSQIRILTTFVYLDHISITTTSQKSYGKKVYCRYYNCLREELEGSEYLSIFFPMNVIRCPRRVGAKYMSISFDMQGEEPQEPIPLVYRVFETPIHEVSVCVGPIYGSESKWLEVAEFIEHYKLIGVKHFYFTIFNMNEYSRKIMDEYLRTGEIELTECHQRAKHHSKWVINVDIDERLIILEYETVGDLLRGYNDTVGEVAFPIRRIQKTGSLPERFESDEQIISEMEFLKYNVSSPVTWGAYKSIYRPEKIAAMYYHFSYQKYPGTIGVFVRNGAALFKHYRTTKDNILGSGWLAIPKYRNFSIVPEDSTFAEKLKGCLASENSAFYALDTIRIKFNALDDIKNPALLHKPLAKCIDIFIRKQIQVAKGDLETTGFRCNVFKDGARRGLVGRAVEKKGTRSAEKMKETILVFKVHEDKWTIIVYDAECVGVKSGEYSDDPCRGPKQMPNMIVAHMFCNECRGKAGCPNCKQPIIFSYKDDEEEDNHH